MEGVGEDEEGEEGAVAGAEDKLVPDVFSNRCERKQDVLFSVWKLFLVACVKDFIIMDMIPCCIDVHEQSFHYLSVH